MWILRGGYVKRSISPLRKHAPARYFFYDALYYAQIFRIDSSRGLRETRGTQKSISYKHIRPTIINTTNIAD